MESLCVFARDYAGCRIHRMRHFRCLVSTLRDACCIWAAQSVAALRNPSWFPGRVRVVQRCRVRARRTLWDGVGVLEQKTGVIGKPRALSSVAFASRQAAAVRG